jgi:hypothetical protein
MAYSDAIPITVGVVGHLDLVPTGEHRLQLIRFFRDLSSSYPCSPVYLFSSAAEGADRFVAEIFLDLKNNNREYQDRFELIIPTPFKTDEYKKDFNSESVLEFEKLAASAKRIFCISCDQFVSDDRPQQYLRAGKFVADSSIILIALWDGEKGKKGGTADIVRHKIAGDDANVADSTFEYDGTVFILPGSRTGSGKVSESLAGTPGLSLDQVLKDPAIKEALDRIEEVNSVNFNYEERESIESQLQLFGYPNKLNSPQKLLVKWFSFFDRRSLRFHSRDMTITIWLFLFGFFFVVTLEVYSNLSHTDLPLAVAMLFIISATFVYWYSRYTGNHRKYLINRTIAEALRIQFYWNIAGIGRNVSDFFLRIHRKDFTWIKHLLSAIYGVTYNNNKITPEAISDLYESWIKDQSVFFRSSTVKMTGQMRFYNSVSNISFLIAFGLLVSIFFLDSSYKRVEFLPELLVIIGTFLGIFALIKAYIQMKGYNQLINLYELMKVIYDRAESKIIETETYGLSDEEKNAYLKELFFVIGKEALIENGNWYQIFKEKEPEIEGI